MHIRVWAKWAVLVFTMHIGCGAAGNSDNSVSQYRLPNGLTVILRPISGARQTAVVTLFSIGGDHDPQGSSGLAHYIEHLYVTAAAGESAIRTAEELMRAYPAGWNAQTGDDYTVFATVVEPSALDAELKHHADRMGKLRITEDDLRRELPRIEQELANVFGGIPALGAQNRARELVRPTPLDGRKGGRIEHLKRLPLEQLQARWQRYYKPANATLVVAGEIEPAIVRPAIQAAFSAIPTGEAAPPAHQSPDRPDRNGALAVQSVSVRPIQPGLGGAAALAFAAPKPDSRDYAPFLVIVNRLLMQSQFAGSSARATAPALRYSYLDDPSVLYVVANLKPAESAEQAASRLRAFVDQVVGAASGAGERQRVKQGMAFFLGTAAFPDAVLDNNVYGVAFGLGRRHQLGIDGRAIAAKLDRTTAAAVRRAGKACFAPNRGAVFVVQPVSP